MDMLPRCRSGLIKNPGLWIFMRPVYPSDRCADISSPLPVGDNLRHRPCSIWVVERARGKRLCE